MYNDLTSLHVLLLCIYFITAILVKWHFIVVLIFISLVINDIDLFHVPISYFYISFGEIIIQNFCSFRNWVIYLFIA
jgi:hypothetical protein